MRSGIFVFLMLFLPFGAAASSHIAGFEFVTMPQTIQLNTVSEKITVQFKDSAGEPVAAGQTACLELITSSVSGEFSSSAENWIPVNILTMNSNWTSRSFYYRDSVNGSPTITVRLALRPAEETRSCSNWPVEEWFVGWTAEQQITVGQTTENAAESGGTQNQIASASEAPSASAGTSDPEFKAKIIGADKAVVLGAQVNFEGVLFGLEGKPVEKADFLWTFGDGTMMRGRMSNHTYNYPGKYIVYLNASASGISLNDSITVNVIPNEVEIAEVKPGDGGWIEIFNGSDFKIDLSHWAISNSKTAFYFLKNTFIDAKTYLVISKENSGIEFFPSGSVFLLYPRGDVAREIIYSGTLKSDESFHNVDGAARVGVESPASGRFIARVSAPAAKNASSENTTLTAEGGDEDKGSPVSQLAAAAPEKDRARIGFKNSGWMWFGSALAIGVLSAVGFLFIKRKGFF